MGPGWLAYTLEGVLAAAIAYAMESWLPLAQPRLSIVRAWCTPSDMRLRAFAAIFVDAALDIFSYRAGVFVPKMNVVRSNIIPLARLNQRSVELWALCWAIRLARRFAWHYLFLLTDSQVAGNQLVHLRARTWLGKQMRLLRSISIRMRQWGLVVGVRWVPTDVQPADPPSRLDAEASLSKLLALWRA